MLPYAIAIFTGAFLLFQVQPLIGKFILPWFGGSPGVWTTCLLFFQTLLLGGYAYAHLLSTRLKPDRQALVHLALLVLALALLPIAPAETWKPTGSGDPTLRILLLLSATLGLPYFVLSSTGPLMQQWFSVTHPGVSPYRLYALSNVGSLLALLSYPFYFEWAFSRQAQANLWSIGLIFFVIACGYCALRLRRESGLIAQAADPLEILPERPSPLDKLLWLSLPAVASVLLLATTNKLCQDVAVIPFLWVLPLSLYLLSFILCFDHSRWYARGVFIPLLAIGVATICHLLFEGGGAPLSVQIVGYSATLFAACMVCHGELYRLKPPPRHLTSFYLYIAAGGALGGFLVAVVAPLVLNQYLELQAGLWALSYLLGVLCFRHRSRTLAVAGGVGAFLATLTLPALRATTDSGWRFWFEDFWAELKLFYGDQWTMVAFFALVFVLCLADRRRIVQREWQPRLAGFLMLLSVALGVVFLIQIREADRLASDASRNFYGTLKVFEYASDEPRAHRYVLMHGAITHGMQFVAPPQSTWPTTYYGEHSGVGLALRHRREEGEPLRVGLVGLGTGSLAAYGEAGDYFRIYEINSDVEKLAHTRFTYLAQSPAEIDVVMGDARLSMEQELSRGEPQRFDVLALDAFSSDAIPVHLLTKEAFELYLDHLAPDGVIAVHISNRHLNLRPVVENLARHFSLMSATIEDDATDDWWLYNTTWVLVTRNTALLEIDEVFLATADPENLAKPVSLWTDDHASVFEIVKRAGESGGW